MIFLAPPKNCSHIDVSCHVVIIALYFTTKVNSCCRLFLFASHIIVVIQKKIQEEKYPI